MDEWAIWFAMIMTVCVILIVWIKGSSPLATRGWEIAWKVLRIPLFLIFGIVLISLILSPPSKK